MIVLFAILAVPFFSSKGDSPLPHKGLKARHRVVGPH